MVEYHNDICTSNPSKHYQKNWSEDSRGHTNVIVMNNRRQYKCWQCHNCPALQELKYSQKNITVKITILLIIIIAYWLQVLKEVCMQPVMNRNIPLAVISSVALTIPPVL